MDTHTCPWWFGYSFDNPLRKFIHNPLKILGEFVEPGQTVVDIGCGLGYFSLALAKLVGTGGKVISLDVQPQMVQRTRRRAERRGLADRINFQVCTPDHLGLTSPVDFALAFWVVHEVKDQKSLLKEIHSLLKPNGRFLIVEPKGHVPGSRFEATVELARSVGFDISEGPPVRFSRAVVCSSDQDKE